MRHKQNMRNEERWLTPSWKQHILRIWDK